MPARAVQVDGDRLLRRLAELAAVGGTEAGGVTRLAYSPEDVAGRELLAGWAREAGLAVSVDAAGNLLSLLPGSEPELPRLVTGSHLDSVVDAGRLDGAYGAVAALECAVALATAGARLRHPLLAVGFSNEEGSRGTPGMVGSTAVAGLPLELDRLDDEGVALRARLAAVGGDADSLPSAAWPTGSVAGFLELHIEQGPVLERAGLPIGIVTAVTARTNVEVVVTGESRHAGTTPMAARRDALVTAAHLVLAVESLARQGHVRVATVGRVEAVPGVRNVVPGRALVSLELRDSDGDRIAAALVRLAGLAEEIALVQGCSIEIQPGPSVAAVPVDPLLAGCIETAARRLGLGAARLPSGAGHDAQVVALVAPVAMCFVPSIGGVSHAAQEDTADEHLVAGARVLLAALVEADARLDPS